MPAETPALPVVSLPASERSLYSMPTAAGGPDGLLVALRFFS